MKELDEPIEIERRKQYNSQYIEEKSPIITILQKERRHFYDIPGSNGSGTGMQRPVLQGL